MTWYRLRRHQARKNRILLGNDDLPGDLEARIRDFVPYCNRLRYDEITINLVPADV